MNEAAEEKSASILSGGELVEQICRWWLEIVVVNSVYFSYILGLFCSLTLTVNACVSYSLFKTTVHGDVCTPSTRLPHRGACEFRREIRVPTHIVIIATHIPGCLLFLYEHVPAPVQRCPAPGSATNNVGLQSRSGLAKY